MRIGIQIEPQFGFAFDDIAAIARDAERLGLESLWCSDHLFLDAESVETNCLEAWTTLAALTQVTTTLRLGTLVTAQSYRNPALLAKIAAGVDHMSGGRLEFGIGAGWKEMEYRAYGYEFPPPPTRIEQLVDTLEIVRRMWTQERATYAGKHYHVEDAQCAPKPVQASPRVWIGASKPRLLRVVARYADAVNIGGFPPPGRYAELMTVLDEACGRVRRDPGAILRSAFIPVVTGATPQDIDAAIEEQAKRAKRSREEWRALRPGWLVGTPDDIVAGLREFAAAGVAYAIVMFPYRRERELLPLFAERVMPAL